MALKGNAEDGKDHVGLNSEVFRISREEWEYESEKVDICIRSIISNHRFMPATFAARPFE